MIDKSISTKLFLNGPILTFTSHPQDTSETLGIATFTGIATAFFPSQTPENNAINDGSITYEWYYDGSRILDASEDNNSNAFIETVGTASTLTLGGLDVNDSGKEVYVLANYVPTAYSQPTGTAVTVGSARSTGNANNELFKSNTAIIQAKPIILINSEPEDSIRGADSDHNYTIDAEVYPTGGLLGYQWQLNDVDLSDGTITNQVTESSSGKIYVSVDDGTSFIIDLEETKIYNSFVTEKTYTLVCDRNIETKLYLTGAAGGNTNNQKRGGNSSRK